MHGSVIIKGTVVFSLCRFNNVISSRCLFLHAEASRTDMESISKSCFKYDGYV
jgi:hypothetical protein